VFDAEPKTAAGKRTVTIPPYVLPVLVDRMASWPVRIGCSSGVMAD